MAGWTVTIDTTDAITPERSAELVSRLADAGGIIAIDDTATSVTLSVETDGDALDAARTAARLLADAGLSGDVTGIHAHTWADHDRALTNPAYPPLVGIKEIATRLGVSRARASELQTRPGFPQPLQVLASGPVWPEAWIAQFEAGWERKGGRPRKTKAS